MAKATSCKEAIANFEKVKGVVAAETDKVRLNRSYVEISEQLRLLSVTDGFFGRSCYMVKYLPSTRWMLACLP